MTESRLLSLRSVAVVLVVGASLSSAFPPTSKRPSSLLSSERSSSGTTCLVLRSEKSTTTEKEKDDQISEMDARILQSMLRDNKLDLEQTSNMKKLLERGIRKDNEDDDVKAASDGNNNNKKEEEEEAYSSQVIKTLADTKFWKAFKRNAAEVLESVSISVTNEIEKGAKVLVGLGFFAWDRAKQDVARALPTAATVPKKKVFQLGETSSFVEQQQPAAEEDGDGDEMTPSQRAKNLRQEFTTPADEISAVTAEIGKIFQRADRQMALRSSPDEEEDKSKDTRNPFYAAFVEEREYQKRSGGDGAAPFYASASLSTTASRGTARLDAAFQRTQKTKLAREKENIAVKGNRLASAAIDSAYQVRSEIGSEENVPGYKTKQLRESTVDASRRLAAAAQKTAGFLGGARSLLLGGGGATDEQQPQQQLPPGADGGKVRANPVDFLDETAYFAFKREEPPPGGSEAAAAATSPGGLEASASSSSAPPPTVTETDFLGGIVIEDNKVVDADRPAGDGGGPFGFLTAFAKRGMGRRKESAESTVPALSSSSSSTTTASPQETEVVEVITDAEVVMGNKDNFNYFDGNDAVAASSSSGEVDGDDDAGGYFTTASYLDDMDPAPTGAAADDGLRRVTAEVITDDDEFDETVFAQANAVDNMSAEDFLRQRAAEEAEEEEGDVVGGDNPFAKATLRTLDVAFLVVEKGASVAPMAAELAQRAAARATEAKLKDSAGSRIGWELHSGNVRGDKRY